MKLLLVEDEALVASFVLKGLRAQGYAVDWVASGEEALARVVDPDLSLVILDLGLPDLDGFEVLGWLRERGATVPVVVLSARGRVDDRVRGLNLGADDYLPKPFAFDELLARIQARLRPPVDGSPHVLRAAGIQIDLLTRVVTVDGRGIDLSAREFSLLETFVRHARHVLSRQQLLSIVWGFDFDPRSNIIEVYVRSLRRKLGHRRIETVRGVGYRLAAEAPTPVDASSSPSERG